MRREYLPGAQTLDAGFITYILLVVVEGFLGREEFDTPLLVALYCFAIALPLLASTAVFVSINDPFPLTLPRSVGRSLVIVGTDALFWHLHPFVGLVFTGVLLVVLLVLLLLFGTVSIVLYFAERREEAPRVSKQALIRL